MSDAAAKPDTRISPPGLAEAVRRLIGTFQPARIYLFGSQATGVAGPDSDYDLMVLVESSSASSYRRAQDAYLDVAIPMDILVWTREEFDWQVPVAASLPATILREGHLLYAA